MNKELFAKLCAAAKPYYPPNDPSHDWNHICRVFSYAHRIHSKEGGDFDVIAAAVLFHDCINIPKLCPEARDAARLSAKTARLELEALGEFDRDKIALVEICVMEHPFSGGITPTVMESKIVQDADRLESTGIIALMRTFVTSGAIGRPIFYWKDPLCKNREPEPANYGLDLAFSRLLKISGLLNTDTARTIAAESDHRTNQFLSLFEQEIQKFPTSADYWDDKF